MEEMILFGGFLLYSSERLKISPNSENLLTSYETEVERGNYCCKALKNLRIKHCLRTNLLFSFPVLQNMKSFLSANVSEQLVVCIFTVQTRLLKSQVFRDKAPLPSTNIHQTLRSPVAKF
jgi:hypothetical protein